MTSLTLLSFPSGGTPTTRRSAVERACNYLIHPAAVGVLRGSFIDAPRGNGFLPNCAAPYSEPRRTLLSHLVWPSGYRRGPSAFRPTSPVEWGSQMVAGSNIAIKLCPPHLARVRAVVHRALHRSACPRWWRAPAAGMGINQNYTSSGPLRGFRRNSGNTAPGRRPKGVPAFGFGLASRGR